MSTVKLIRGDGNVLIFEGADMLDETPLLDIKPYIPKYDSIPSASAGWTANMQCVKNRKAENDRCHG